MSIAAGVRFRFANGLRAAMSVWGALLVGYAVAAGLKAAPPLVKWTAAWMGAPFARRLAIDAALAVSLGLFARAAFAGTVGGWGREQLDVLPLSHKRRFAIDWASVGTYLLPPLIALVVLVATVAGASAKLVEPILAIAVAAAIGAVQKRSERVRTEGDATGAAAIPHELRWLLRSGGQRLAWAIVGATLVAAASILAIRNNDVVRPFAVLRIESFFVAIAAGLLAGEVVRSRAAARPYRLVESVVPIGSADRVRSLLLTAAPLFAPALVAVALLRFSALAILFGVIVLPLLLLAGEAQALRGGRGDVVASSLSYVAAVAGAVDGRIALAVAVLFLPYAWIRAVRADASSDLPVMRSEAPA